MKARPSQFSAEHKQRILPEAAVASGPREIGALLRREGLYSSHLITWRRQRERGELGGLSAQRRGAQGEGGEPAGQARGGA